VAGRQLPVCIPCILLDPAGVRTEAGMHRWFWQPGYLTKIWARDGPELRKLKGSTYGTYDEARQHLGQGVTVQAAKRSPAV
jgi:hypothetical protein